MEAEVSSDSDVAEALPDGALASLEGHQGPKGIDSGEEFTIVPVHLQERRSAIENRSPHPGKGTASRKGQGAENLQLGRPLPCRGLVNTGNTCFLNSVIQVGSNPACCRRLNPHFHPQALSSIKEFHVFLQQRLHIAGQLGAEQNQAIRRASAVACALADVFYGTLQAP